MRERDWNWVEGGGEDGDCTLGIRRQVEGTVTGAESRAPLASEEPQSQNQATAVPV